jgi:hypothetical protein
MTSGINQAANSGYVGRQAVGHAVLLQEAATKAYLALLIFAIPMDWFKPTGLLLREGGARPAIPLMLAASIYLVCSRWSSLVHGMPRSNVRVLSIFGGIFLCGLVAFSLNLIFAWSRFGGAKDPVTQFATQTLLLLIVPLILVTHAELFAEARWREFALRALPWAAALHLAFAILNAAQLLDPNGLPLSLFRTGDTHGRISGLMSEPSYLGTLAAMYGLPLLLLPATKGRLPHAAIALLLFATAMYANAKTVIPVAVCGLVGYVWYSRRPLLTPGRIAVALGMAGVSAVIILRNSVLDLQDNLSSAMRIGSTVTALTACLAGYGIAGVGIGQFHFMYLPRFMPRFLLLSTEALVEMSSATQSRASTYNIFARYWIETGVAGLVLFLALLRRLFIMARQDRRPASLAGMLLVATSLGFLLTQDPYCYPPLLLGSALVLGAHNDLPAYVPSTNRHR